jgi:hypothetical protein
MAGVRPFFISGATAKIRLNGKTMAFCTDVSYTIQVITKTPKILGMYEATSVEPLGYTVTGSFTIIRYAKNAINTTRSNIKSTARNDAGNGVGNWGTQWGGTAGDFLARNGIGNDGRAHEALDPSKFANGTTFDIEIYQEVPKYVDASFIPGEVFNPSDSLNPVPVGTAAITTITEDKIVNASVSRGGKIGIAKIRNARITQSDFRLSKKGIAQETFNFSAIYVDGDGYVADYSGLGQHF